MNPGKVDLMFEQHNHSRPMLSGKAVSDIRLKGEIPRTKDRILGCIAGSTARYLVENTDVSKLQNRVS